MLLSNNTLLRCQRLSKTVPCSPKSSKSPKRCPKSPQKRCQRLSKNRSLFTFGTQEPVRTPWLSETSHGIGHHRLTQRQATVPCRNMTVHMDGELRREKSQQ